MIWLFKINEVFWGNKPKVNDYLFDTDDINFDITNYDISLVSDSNRKEIYKLEPRFASITIGNPFRILSNNKDISILIDEFFQTKRDDKINEIIN